MKNITRTVAASLAVAGVTLAPTATEAAGAAKPTKTTKTAKTSAVVKSHVRQLLKDISIKDRALARVTVSKAVTRLGDDNEAALIASTDDDRLELADLRADASAADSTYDAKVVRSQVRTFRVELYTQAAGVVRAAELLAVEAADDFDALAFVDLALDAALSVDSNDPGARTALKQARADLESARDVLAALAEPAVEDPEVIDVP